MADLQDGESIEMQGSGAKPYVIRNMGGVYSCSCPAWRNQSLAIEKRTCKHIRKLRGDAAEQERVGGAASAPVRRPKEAGDEEEKEAGPPLLLAQAWDNAADLSGWWMSEKLDGVRAYWDGRQFLSRQGNVFHAPDWFVEGLPEVPLDGELWIDRKKFQRTVSIVRRQDKSDHWKEVRFLVFDAPRCGGDFESRLGFLEDCLRSRSLPHAGLHPHQPCKGLEHLREELARVESLGGEGLMLRQPRSVYEVGRSFTLVKVKSFRDAEAEVVAHQPGRGRHEGRLGALAVRLPDGTEFSVGTGFSDAQRSAPPPIGATITFRYQELSDGGVPRFPSFVRLFSSPEPASDLPRAPAGKGKKGAAKVAKPAATKPAATEPAASKPASAKPAAAKASKGAARHFELVEGKSSKFWEIQVDGCQVTVRFGRIGTTGQTQVKDFDDEAAALGHADKLIQEKTKKGYTETAGS
jgi:DNA ligase-1